MEAFLETAPKRWPIGMKLLSGGVILVLPYFLIYAPGVSPCLGRAVAISIPILFLTVGVFWYGINPRAVFIRPTGRLSEPKFGGLRPRIEVGIRIAVIAFGLAVAFGVTIPFLVDIVTFARGYEPHKVTAVVEHQTRPLMVTSYLMQSVELSGNGAREYYHLLYSTVPLEVGKTYQFTVLPRSHMILDVRQSGASSNLSDCK